MFSKSILSIVYIAQVFITLCNYNIHYHHNRVCRILLNALEKRLPRVADGADTVTHSPTLGAERAKLEIYLSYEIS